MQKIVVRKDLYDEIMNKAGLPTGTISGNYKKVADNPSKWEYVTQEQILKNESGNDRRAYLANKAPLIIDVQELSATEKNYKAVGTAYLLKMRNEVFTRNVICKENNKKVSDVDVKHIFKDKNTDENRTLRVRALPFVLPIIEKYGKRGIITKRPAGTFTEIVGKADITMKNGAKKRCAIAVILVTDKKNRQSLKQLSVFVVNNKVIKSLATDAPRMGRLVRSGLKNPCASNSHFSTHNSNIPQSAKKSTVKPDYNGEDMLHKSFDITVADITEKNKQKKIEQVEKALTAIYQKQPFAIRHIKADRDSARYDDIVLRIRGFDRDKIQKAVHKMAFSLDASIKSAKGEAFTYKAQEELTDRIVGELTEKTKSLYSFLISFLGLPEVRIVSKANLTYKGKILYDPESGKPISKAEWKKFTAELEKFLNRNYSGTGKKIVLSTESLGRILERLSKTNSFEALKKMRLSGLKYSGKTFDWISDDIRNMQNALGESIDRMTQARIQVAVDSAAQRVTKVTDAIRNDIQQTIIDGIKNRQSKAKISQNLFDKCSGLNRDFQRIADTEIQNNTNNAYIKEEVYNTPGNEKVYFKRFEVKDDNTCKKCRAIAGKIALFSDIPLDSERIKDPYADYAIWEGKTDGAMPTGTVHPYCRGGWYRYYPDIK